MEKSRESLIRELFVISLPIMAANLLQSLYNLGDTYFLGKMGAEAVAAPSITNNISSFLIVFGTGFSLAGTTLIGQSYGRTKQKGPLLDRLASQVFLINISLSIVVFVLGFILTDPLCSLLAVPEGLTYEYTSDYLRLTFIGMPMMFIDQVLRATLQALGDSVTPLIVSSITVGLNFILDPIFIFTLDLGVAGAAHATNIARLVSAVIGLWILFSGKKGIKIQLRLMKPDMPLLSKIFSIGFPSALGSAITSLGFAVMQGVVNSFGPSVIAAFGIGNKITGFFQMPAMGISQGVTVISARKLGAGDEKGAQSVIRIALVAILTYVTIGMVFCFFKGDLVMRFFVSDPDVIYYGVQFFHVITFSIIVFSAYTILTGAFNGGGATKYTMITNIIRLWFIRVPLCYILPKFFGSYGLWFGMFISNVLAFVLIMIPFQKGKWKRQITIE